MSASEPARERQIVPPSQPGLPGSAASVPDAGSPDLETTAELPVLDVAAYEAAHAHGELSSTDTWVAPAPAELRVRPPDDGPSLERHNRLEDDLKALSASLREFEERLAHKGERLTEIEGALELSRTAQAAAEERADALSRELTDTRLALSTARAHAEELTQRLAARDAEMRLLRDRDRSLDASLAARDRALARAQQQLEEVRLQAAAHFEALHAREGRRGVFEALLRGLHDEVGRRESQVTQALGELTVHRERSHALTAELTAAQERITRLTSQAHARTSTDAQALNAAAERLRALEAERGARESRIEALSSELDALRSQHERALADVESRHSDALNAAQSALQASRERTEAAQSDVHAAEDAINRLESELRTKSARIEELTRLNDDWRATVEAARQSLEERDSLIRRLEAEAAHSTALLDSIQQNIQFLDAQSAGAEPAAAARLLIRAEGDGEVVHVLGRKTSIGRTPDNDVQIDTKFVSRHHAVILTGPTHAIIEDLNSTNGVLVNNRRITRQSLKDGDGITVGKTQFRFAVRQPAERREA
jgi:chromosome segregation ATPase